MKRLLVVMLLMQASGVRADVYTWTDVRGTAHYTNKEYEIPVRYRPKAKPLHLEAVEPGSAPASQQGTPSQPQGTPPIPQAAPLPPPSAPAPPPVVRAPFSPAPAGGQAAPKSRRRGQSGDG
ncbi:MAG: hypothetical protein P4L44_01640 [Oryzomonas sp.]|uniref:hypothetical protein n=1 Tax=Oryzomonas sp. TaxID=2855186 RepID=UPI00283BD2E0|nr:hypothetical protein [Oryzomonas sp.]MDR3578645.1 hypothetical protein [Oryzomonas sp.]